jgi:Ras GTPase-activating protein-binding protein 2
LLQDYQPIMATDTSTTFVNGMPNGAPPHATDATKDQHSVEEVAWLFVESYYNTMSKSPEKLFLFFKEKSQFAAGVEEDKVKVFVGQKASFL